MKLYSKTLLAATSVILFNACGGGDSSSGTFTAAEIAQRDYIFIYAELPDAPNACDAYLTEAEQEEANVDNLIATKVANGTTCEDYNRTDGYNCLENHYDMGDITCVIAYDVRDETASNKTYDPETTLIE
ncbi:MAG: hypothetical protein PHO65_07805 [Sulfurovum sp.]|nr:hypothetical protein [Sulfurovum sp.]